MAKKTNYEVNGKKYFRKRVKINGKQVLFLGDSLSDVERQIEEFKTKPIATEFSAVFIDWLEVIKKPELRASSYNRYETIYRLHISSAPFTRKRLEEITEIDIQKLINSCKSRSNANFIRDLLKSFFLYCLKTKKINYNPMIAVTMPKSEYKPPKKKSLSELDVKKLMDHFETDKSAFIYVFVMMTGIRNGELCALKVKDVDLDKRVIRIYKSLNRVTVNGHSTTLESKTKTQSSIRNIPISKELVPYIKEHMLADKKKHLKHGMKYSDECYLFTSNICSPLRGDRLSTRWRDLQEALGIESISLHGLRHTFGSMLAKKNVPIKVVSELMGHSDISITANIYTHTDDEQKELAIDTLSKFLG